MKKTSIFGLGFAGLCTLGVAGPAIAQPGGPPFILECSSNGPLGFQITGIFKITNENILKWNRSSAVYEHYLSGPPQSSKVTIGEKSIIVDNVKDTGSEYVHINIQISRIDGSTYVRNTYRRDAQSSVGTCRPVADPSLAKPVF